MTVLDDSDWKNQTDELFRTYNVSELRQYEQKIRYNRLLSLNKQNLTFFPRKNADSKQEELRQLVG